VNILSKKKNIIADLTNIIEEAGRSIIHIYENYDSNYITKEDNSPLTKADTISNKIIMDGLRSLTPSLPILSEEEASIPLSVRSKWNQFWLIDPLDGTKEFIKKNGEFTVNIALIANNQPIFGLIYVPVTKELYYGSDETGSYRIKDSNAERIRVRKSSSNDIKVVTSRSHSSDEVLSFIRKIKHASTISIGSSLKFCLIASGKADIYPRFGPTSEWDTAAGEAILKFAGGETLTMNNTPISYNQKESTINPSFIAASSKELSMKYLSS
tara:strand:- start:4283 stop:5089 length:807 start_codon:yes stop_codon:yes gene_type:complete